MVGEGREREGRREGGERKGGGKGRRDCPPKKTKFLDTPLVTDRRTDGHRATAKTALKHSVTRKKTLRYDTYRQCSLKTARHDRK